MLDDVVTNAIAGGLSGITVDFILFPLDTIKTRLQSRKGPASVQNVKHLSKLPNGARVAAEALKAKGFYQGKCTPNRRRCMPPALSFFLEYRASLGHARLVSCGGYVLDNV